jgi:hypothetical protein
LVVAWLSATLRQSGPYPLLAIAGEQGSAKTVLTKILRALVDPNAAPARALPREDYELFITATNGHVLAYDNLSGLPAWLPTAFVAWRVAGASRYDESIRTGTRYCSTPSARSSSTVSRISSFDPIWPTRAIFLALTPITDARRRSEKELWREFDAARPRLFGALLDMAAHRLRRLPRIHLERLPRMADSALWASACETALWPAGTFSQTYS